MDEKDILQKKIDEAKINLPEETKNAISAIDWHTVILNMREKRGYSFSQLEDLGIITELLLYGLIKPENFPKEIESKLKISSEESSELINELNNLIFQKIREELVKNSEKRKIQVTQEKKEVKIENSDEKENNKVLNQSGIQIVSEEKKEEKPEIQTEKREDMLKKVENPEPTEIKIQTPSFLEQKLGSSFKIAPTETKYPDTTVKHSPIGSTKTDPYREAVE